MIVEDSLLSPDIVISEFIKIGIVPPQGDHIYSLILSLVVKPPSYGPLNFLLIETPASESNLKFSLKIPV